MGAGFEGEALPGPAISRPPAGVSVDETRVDVSPLGMTCTTGEMVFAWRIGTRPPDSGEIGGRMGDGSNDVTRVNEVRRSSEALGRLSKDRVLVRE